MFIIVETLFFKLEQTLVRRETVLKKHCEQVFVLATQA